MEVEATAEKLHRLLQKVDLEDAFEHFERNRDGIISRKAFNRGLRALKFDLSESEMHSLLERFDANDDGYVSFEEFRSFARGRAPLSTKKRRRRGSSEDFDGDVDRIRIDVDSCKTRRAHPRQVCLVQ